MAAVRNYTGTNWRNVPVEILPSSCVPLICCWGAAMAAKSNGGGVTDGEGWRNSAGCKGWVSALAWRTGSDISATVGMTAAGCLSGDLLSDSKEVGGRDNASATTLPCPDVCLISEVNTDKKANCRCWRADHGSDTRERADTSGLWSVRMWNFWPPSRRKRPAIPGRRWNTDFLLPIAFSNRKPTDARPGFPAVGGPLWRVCWMRRPLVRVLHLVLGATMAQPLWERLWPPWMNRRLPQMTRANWIGALSPLSQVCGTLLWLCAAWQGRGNVFLRKRGGRKSL